MDEYDKFLANKRLCHGEYGFKVKDSELNSGLFDWQKQIVKWACQKGQSALFEACGLGKTIQQLEWARLVSDYTGGDVLVLAPLAVASQTVREGKKFGIPATICREQSHVRPGINIANYEMLSKLNSEHFIGIVLDECFPPDTPIDVFNIDKSLGCKYIKDINKNDILFNASGDDYVKETYKRRINRAVRIYYNGRNITCSENHPFFTMYGWRCAQDIHPGDCIMATGAAMRMVRHGLFPEERISKNAAVLRSILLSEMENEYSGAQGEGSHEGGSCENRSESLNLEKVERSKSHKGNGTDNGIESYAEPGDTEESFRYIAEDEVQTFRAWGKWSRTDLASANRDGCNIRELDTGISYITGSTKTWFSDMLQSRLRESRSENSNRDRRELALCEKRSGCEKGSCINFFRVESVEILEQGHPELEKYRDESGVVYFYDIKAVRHPSFSVNGALVHNSSILKSFMGKTKQMLMDDFKGTKYKLTCTATPAPNDLMEILNQSDFLGIMSRTEALMRWFVHDSGDTSKWRIKGHAEKEFWMWVSSWAVYINKPSDIGYDDNGFILPELKTVKHLTKDRHSIKSGRFLADYSTVSATNLFSQLRKTVDDRTDLAAEVVNSSDEEWVIWCNTNDESKLLAKKINGSIEMVGSMSLDKKEQILKDFAEGKIKKLITKASMSGFGLNWQHCRNMAFVGLSYSFEQRYQAIRRCWRFGQEREVFDHVILSPAEVPIWETVARKEKIQLQLEQNTVNNIVSFLDVNKRRLELLSTVKGKSFKGKDWEIILGDSCKEIKKIPDDSVHFQIFSPPFSNLYVYSDFESDMGNTQNDQEFFDHFDFLIPELKRILIPGRLCAVHCSDIPQFKWKTGKISLIDFPGDLVKAFQKHGFLYHSKVTIWKDPVTEMQRTKALGLLHAQIKKDSSVSRQGLPDYLLIFRKWPDDGKTNSIEPVNNYFDFYIGNEGPEGGFVNDEKYSIAVWQRYASPVWFDIDQGNVLNKMVAREEKDERHVCPLQLDVIKRAIHLWTNKGDIVFSPFAGIGSELYGAVEMERKALGIELKPTYVEQAIKNLKKVENRRRRFIK